MTLRNLSWAPSCLLALAGCAGTGSDRYPSLAVRDVERAEGRFEPVSAERLDVPEIEVALSGPLGERLAALVGQARDAHRSFLAAVPTAERRVATAAGSPVGSDAWAAAQVSLADLDSARSLASVPLGDLDILYAAARVQAEDATAVSEARANVIAMVAEEDVVLERLRAGIR